MAPISRAAKIIIVLLLLILAAGLIATQYVIRHAEPILRARVIQALSTRFDSNVEMGAFQVSILHGLNVQGDNLTLQSKLFPELPPQIVVGSFMFHMNLLDLFRTPINIGDVEVSQLTVRIPPKSKRSAYRQSKKHYAKLTMGANQITCKNALLIVLTDDPSKQPLRFEVNALTLRRVGPDRPLHFTAQLMNPKPVGNIASEGNFGPWNAEQPGDSPMDGTYSFTHADLSTTKGISGMLSSHGRFVGKLDKIAVRGTTDTPDFSLHVSGHKVALHTDFQAIVNGTNGNTYLQPVHANFLRTSLTATGYVVRSSDRPGHDVHLNVTVNGGRVEDLLWLGAKTAPPVMMGTVGLQARFDLPAGKVSFTRKLRLQGTFAATNVGFSNLHVQKRVDELSLRSQGKTKEARNLAREHVTNLTSLPQIPGKVHGNFRLTGGKLTLPQLICNVPGTEIALTGTYTLDGQEFNFVGKARMNARVSTMVGGWKGVLLKPADRFFSGKGVNTEIPISITGTQSKPRFGFKL